MTGAPAGNERSDGTRPPVLGSPNRTLGGGGLPSTLIRALGQVTHALNDEPTPAEAAAAVHGALAPCLGVAAVAIMAGRAHGLVPYGTSGLLLGSPVVPLPIGSEHTASRAYREAEVIVEPFNAERFAFGSVIGDAQITTCAAAAIISAGRPVGALALLSTTATRWTSLEDALVFAIGSSLGLWLTHPSSGLPSQHPLDQVQLAPLSERQLAILQLVDEGHNSAAIAARIGYSVSTVKKDVHELLRVFGVTSRTELVRAARRRTPPAGEEVT